MWRPDWFFQQQQQQHGWYCQIFAATKLPAEKVRLCIFSVDALDLMITSQDSLSPHQFPPLLCPPSARCSRDDTWTWVALSCRWHVVFLLQAPHNQRGLPAPGAQSQLCPPSVQGGRSRPGTSTFLTHLWVLSCFGTESAAQSYGHLLLTPWVSSSPWRLHLCPPARR